jgi:hypothetical protein
MRLARKPAALLAVLGCAAPVSAQISALRFDAAKVPVGTVLHLDKSNLDGTHAARISCYVAAVDRVEALKWDRGGDEATLVVALLDWSRFSVRGFRASHLARGQAPQPRARMDVDDAGLLTMTVAGQPVMERPLQLTHFPWQSFDFDFTGLALALPHLRDPSAELRFWRTDYVYGDPPGVAEYGEVTLRFERTERHAGKRARRYAIGGPGLAGKWGTWWADARTGLLVEFELPVGDEPGYDSVRVRLDRAETMTPAAWAAFQRRAVGD